MSYLSYHLIVKFMQLNDLYYLYLWDQPLLVKFYLLIARPFPSHSLVPQLVCLVTVSCIFQINHPSPPYLLKTQKMNLSWFIGPQKAPKISKIEASWPLNWKEKCRYNWASESPKSRRVEGIESSVLDLWMECSFPSPGDSNSGQL